jgi:hypothetical protein
VKSGESLGSLFDHAWLNPSGSLSDPHLSNQLEQSGYVFGGIGAELLAIPGNPNLNGMFEAQLAREAPSLYSRLRHQQANQIVGEHVDP